MFSTEEWNALLLSFLAGLSTVLGAVLAVGAPALFSCKLGC